MIRAIFVKKSRKFAAQFVKIYKLVMHTLF